MKYTGKQIDSLRERVGATLSGKRFLHTLGVEDMAARIGRILMPNDLDRLRVAALLHDISKEYSEAEYFDLIKRHKIDMSADDLSAPALWHSITAPYVVMSDFSEFADEDVLSAVYNHTVGSPDMSVFDEIILLADYIEEGRTYKNCVDLRVEFLEELKNSGFGEKAVLTLHKAVLKSLENNIKELASRGKSYHKRTALTRDWVLSEIERYS